MLTTRILTVAMVFSLAACATPTPEQRIINDAATALGGRANVQAARSLVLEGEGTQYNLGQDLRPGANGQTFKITEYRRSLDLAGRRTRIEMTRTPNFSYFQGPQAQRQVQGLDGDVAFNVAANGNATRAGTQVAQDRRADLYHHPLALVAAALAEGTTLSNARDGAERSVEVALRDGPKLVLVTDAAGLPTRIESNTYHANLGDVKMTSTFGSYAKVDNLNLPTQIATKVDDFTTGEYRIAKQSINADVAALAAPAAVASAAAPTPAAPNVAAEIIAPGIWLLAGGSHHSVLVEFADHLAIIDAPQSEARTLAVIAKAKELQPNKPLTQVVTTHHHFDHTAGIRAAVANGLTIITHAGNVDFFREVAKRAHTIQPDTLAKQPRGANVEGVDGERVFKDSAMEMTVYDVTDNPHSNTMLMVYFPKAKLIVEVDAFAPNSAVYPYAANLLENITKRKLQVDRVVPLHGTIAKLAELTKAATATAP
jgi:glyoxylase-like metal-dependent hydrolase (beta-lactamase superfamily II)